MNVKKVFSLRWHMRDVTIRMNPFFFLLFMAWLCLCPSLAPAQHTRPRLEPIVVKVIRLDHADAQQLASVLRPLLTKDGRITAYAPTNTLIIRDRKSLVAQLVGVIKGETQEQACGLLPKR